MLEKIYTIPINEAFDASGEDHSKGCPFCALYQRFEYDQLDIILGGAMMEPDIRIKTNEQGFCHKHYEKMFTMKNRLGMALMIESHLDQLKKDMQGGFSEIFSGKGSKAVGRIEKLKDSCYICGRIEHIMDRIFENAALLWESDTKVFGAKIEKQPYFCLDHYRRFIEAGQKNINKKRFADFYAAVSGVETAYFDKLREDVSWFCKKFDYRYESEPWKDSKDAIERAIKFLTGKE